MHRADQDLGDDDFSFDKYQKFGNLFNDYRDEDSENDLAVTCYYDFLKHLSVGDELIITNETGNLSPFVYSLELDYGEYEHKTLRVTRKIYSGISLDVYVVDAKEPLVY